MPKRQSKIEKLIAELCPNGVEYRELGEVISLEYGKPLKGNNRNSGEFPVLGSNGRVGFHNSFVVNGPCLIIGRKGSAGALVWEEKNCYPIDTTFFVKLIYDKLDLKYLFHKLSTLQLTDKKQDGGVPGINRNNVYKIEIPIPPLAIQHEIVNILDTFTTLEAELEAELEARKKQYEYYRDELLTFGDDVEWKTLGEVGQFVRGNGLPKSDFTESGVGCIHYGQIYTYYGTFTDRTKSFVSPETAKKLQKVHKNDLIITNTSENIEDVCKTVVWLGNDEIVTGGHASIFKHNENPKYLAYYTQTQMFFDEKRKLAKGTKVIDVSAKDLAKIKIPIPPLAEQERIVAILDQFDALVNDISVGLPAELQARRKQYEYYRNKLLTFKEKQ